MLGLQHVVTLDIRLQHIAVAPPRGVRGLKYQKCRTRPARAGRTPSWGAWIEIESLEVKAKLELVAPPRGVRGLKSEYCEACRYFGVAPPRGVRGLKL